MATSNTDSDSFGRLLHTFRKRRHLTQQHLAQMIGMHRHEMSRWENGEVLPASRAIVLELARCLHLNDQEARQFLDASLTTPLPLWGVPFPRNLFFTGREELLERLHTYLTPDQKGALTRSWAISGLGGVGKTQLALEYAYRHALEYRAVFWIEAETREQILSCLRRIAELLDLPEQAQTDQNRIVTAVEHWLITHSNWFLIWDNLQDLELLHRFLPSAQHGAFLITTRNQALGTLARGIDLLPMEQEEGIVFLLRRAKLLEPDARSEQPGTRAASMASEYAAARDLVTRMGGLPLALDQAGAYIEETGCSLLDYLLRYKQQRSHMLDRRGRFAIDHPHSVVATFHLAMEQVKQEHKAAADILRFCAFLYAEAIPEELLMEQAAHLGPGLESMAADPFHFDQALAALRRLSLIQWHPQTQTFSLHRLVQEVLRTEMSEQEQTLWKKRVEAALNALFPEVTYQVWKRCERLLPHGLSEYGRGLAQGSGLSTRACPLPSSRAGV